MDRLTQLFADANQIVFLTGAGVSTASGISDFRGPDGLWTKSPEKEKLSDIYYWRSRQKVREDGWQDFRARFHSAAFEPNPAHTAIGDLAGMGKVSLVATQNVDMLHERGGVPDDLMYHVHGKADHVACTRGSCKYTEPIAYFLDRLEGDVDPSCLLCRKPLKPGYVMFGEDLDHSAFEDAYWKFREADLCVVVGSSLKVFPAANLPNLSLGAQKPLVIINNQPTELDGFAEVVSSDPCEVLLPDVVAALK